MTLALLRKVFKPLAILFFLSLTTFSSSAQNADGQMMVLEIEGLTPQTYGEIVKHFRTVDGMEVVEACVPVKLIVVEHDLTGDAIEAVKESIAHVMGTAEVAQLNTDLEGFRQQCQAARRGLSN